MYSLLSKLDNRGRDARLSDNPRLMVLMMMMFGEESKRDEKNAKR